MATERKWGKRGLTLTFSTDKRPVPKVSIPYPLPDFGTETSPLIQVSLETLDNVPGIRVVTISPEGLPRGFRDAQWSLQHTEFSGLVAPNTLTWKSIPISAGPLSLFYSFPTANATHRFRVVLHTIAPGLVAEDAVYPFVAIVTPMDYRPPTWEEFLAAQSTANSAASAASAAQSSADSANAALADISSDGKLTPVEKQRARLEWDTILAERSGIQGQADTFGVSRTAYDSAFQTLANYLNAGTAWSSGAPSWLSDANLGTTTDISGATFRANWKALYDARQALLNAVADKARQNAAYADALARSNYNLVKNGSCKDTAPPAGSYEAAALVNYGLSNPGLIGTFLSPNGWVRKLSCGAGGNAYDYVAEWQCSPGEQFYAQCYAAIGTYGGGTIWIGLAFYDKDSLATAFYSSETVNTFSWANPQKITTKATAPATVPGGGPPVKCKVFIQLFNPPVEQDAYFNHIYAGRMVSGALIEADAVQTVHLDAYAVTAAKIATDAVKTSDYAEDAYGNPTAGAWMGVNTTQPFKCGPNGLQIGKGVFNQQSLITERIANGYFWQSAQGWGLSGTNAPVWSSTNPHTTGSGNVATVNTGSVPSGDSGSVTTTGSASQVIQLGVPDPNATAQNLTLWLRSEYAFSGTGASFEGVSAYAKVYLTNLGAGGSETLIGTLNITTADTWTQGTFDLDSVYTAAGAYGLRIEISSTTNVFAGPTSASVTARARLADVKFTA